MWIDSDSLITNLEIDINMLVDGDHCLYVSRDWGWSHFSTGNFILRKSKQWETLFDAFREVSQTCNNEQETINTIYEQNIYELRDAIKELNRSYLGAVPDFSIYQTVKPAIGDTFPWNEYKVIQPWKEGDFLVHITGIDNPTRVRIMKNYFHQYLESV
jgi:hypothetical protein